MSAAFFFGVLGPLSVLQDGESVSVGGPKERAVLATLLARANHLVTVDMLVEAVWADHPPRSAERTLQAYVARIRGVLEPERSPGTGSTILVKEGSGYRLRLETEQLDALRFEELACRGSQQLQDGDSAAALTLREALALWRGDAMAEFRAAEACDVEARRLDEMRLASLEDRLDADLAAGAASELVAELESLVAQHEYRERLWAQLMLALYRSGRQGDALGAYRRARAVLVEQMGIEPGHELRALEAAILHQEPALDLAAASGPPFGLPSPLESVGPAFVGRDAELAWLRTAWLDAADGRGGFVSLLGPEGIGKTRLVAELAREVQRSGGVVLYGRCGDTGSGIRALLDQALGTAGTSTDELEGEPVAALGGALMRMLTIESRGRPVLLAVDDVHRADADTIDVLADMAAWAGAGSLLVVATFRTDVDAPDLPLPGHGDVGAHLTLRGLDREALQRVCEMYAIERWWPADIDRLHELTGGVPLQVHELASEWAKERATRDVGEAADRSAAAQARLAGLRAEIAQSVDGIQHVLEQRRANMAPRHAEGERASPEGGATPPSPYKGLAAFEPSDAADFFGRERLVAELVARLAGARLLAVVGPSGSGKSSLIRAGLLPALATGVLPVAGGWKSVIVTPGKQRSSRDPLGDTGTDQPAGGGRQLVFVDQFEELFTTGLDRLAQGEFVDRVVAAAHRPDGAVIVLAVRADHLDRCSSFPDLAELITGNDVLVGPMREVELRRAIERPAQRAGGTFEPGLVDVMIADVAGRPGALPLLSTALAETWERRVDGVLTLSGYTSAGGVNGVLASLAEDTFLALGPPQRQSVRRLLVRLCEMGEVGALDVRRRLPLAEVEADENARVGVAALVDRRLLVIDRDTVTVAHEALLREWPRLRAWMDEDVQGRRMHLHIADAARSWKASDEDASELYRGTRLDSALDWAAVHDTDVDPVERAFLDASADEAARELTDAHRRAAEKARDNRRLHWSLIGVAGLLVIAVIAGALFVRQRDRAEQVARDATARRLASEATGAIEEDPELAMLLALEAVRTTERDGDEPLPEAVSALHQATQSSRIQFRRDEAARLVAVSGDGARIATGSASDLEAVLVWDADSGDKLHTLEGPGQEGEAWQVEFSPDGRRLAASYGNQVEGEAIAVIVWDTATGDEVARMRGLDDQYFYLAFGPDGRLLLTISEGGGDTLDRVTMWDTASSTERLGFDLEHLGGEPEFLPDGTAVLIPEGKLERVGLYSTEDGTRLRQVRTSGFEPESVTLHASSGLLGLASQTSREVQVRELRTGQLERSISTADGGPAVWSPDGDQLAVAGVNESPIRIIDVSSGEDALVLRGHQSGSWDVAYIADGDRLASVGATGELRVWDVTADGPPALGAVAPRSGAPWHVVISPDGSELLVDTDGQTIERLAAGSGELTAERTDQLVGRLPFRSAVSSDWRVLASANQSDGSAAILDMSTLTPIEALPACTSPVAFSSNGALLVLDGRGICDAETGRGLFEPPTGADLRSRVIEVGPGREVIDIGEGVLFHAVFNPQGRFAADRYVAVNVGNDRLDLYDVVERRLIDSLSVPDGQFFAAFDPTGRWLVGSTAAGRIWVLDFAAVVAGTPAEDAIVHDWVAHRSGIPEIAIGADGTLATIGFGEEVKLWTLPTGEPLLELRTAPAQGKSTIAFSPDGSYVLYSDGDVVRKYLRDTEDLVTLAEGQLTRDFTADECRRYLDAECT